MKKICTMMFLVLNINSHKKQNIISKGKFKTGKIFNDPKKKKKSQRHSEHRRTSKMNLFPKNFSIINYFCLKAPS